jgi:hypothetical protein
VRLYRLLPLGIADDGTYVKIISVLLRDYHFNTHGSGPSVTAFTAVIYFPLQCPEAAQLSSLSRQKREKQISLI